MNCALLQCNKHFSLIINTRYSIHTVQHCKVIPQRIIVLESSTFHVQLESDLANYHLQEAEIIAGQFDRAWRLCRTAWRGIVTINPRSNINTAQWSDKESILRQKSSEVSIISMKWKSAWFILTWRLIDSRCLILLRVLSLGNILHCTEHHQNILQILSHSFLSSTLLCSQVCRLK